MLKSIKLFYFRTKVLFRNIIFLICSCLPVCFTLSSDSLTDCWNTIIFEAPTMPYAHAKKRPQPTRSAFISPPVRVTTAL
jgi:hypothetical protein